MQAVMGLNGTATGKAPKVELGVTHIKAGGVGWRGDVKAEMRAQGIDERCSLSSFTVTRRDGGGNKGRKRERERRCDRWARFIHTLVGHER